MAQPAHPTATHEGIMASPASEHGGGFPPFESHTFLSQLIWLALAFGLLYYLMDKVALPRIQAILHDRATRLSSDLDEAQRMKSEAEAARSRLREVAGRCPGEGPHHRHRDPHCPELRG